MKKIFFAITILTCLVTLSCENESGGVYTGTPAIYFSDFSEKADSVTYSFIGKNKDIDTVFLNIKLLGYKQEVPKKVKIRIITDKTTAIAGEHYEALQEEYDFSPNSFDYNLPVVLKKHQDLDNSAYILALELLESEDFKIAFADKAKVRILFSNIIMKPAIWDATLASVFGVYSKTKHKICMDIMGRPFPETTQEFNLERNVWRNFGWICNAYFKDNIVMDNDLVPPARILPWF
jgi:hypothetical protein